jgi:mono/diheme cytochrome c family protein
MQTQETLRLPDKIYSNAYPASVFALAVAKALLCIGILDGSVNGIRFTAAEGRDDMKNHISIRWLTLLLTLLMAVPALAGLATSGPHARIAPGEATPATARTLGHDRSDSLAEVKVDNPGSTEMDQSDDKASRLEEAEIDSHMQHGHHHVHLKWETPPLEYANKRSERWTDAAAIARGQQIFQTHCTVCHGIDGRGTGPASKTLAHAPADLTNHFHNRPGDGDGYLFWRVSKGATVEPFKSMRSAMPAFETFLSEDQRWDVLAYVHTQFHRGFKMAGKTQLITGEGIVIAVVPTNEQIVVDHGEIAGFMAAMTMGYKVVSSSLLDGLKAGDHIRFTIDTKQNVIVKIGALQE